LLVLENFIIKISNFVNFTFSISKLLPFYIFLSWISIY